jgi:hypothetical protein
MSQSHLLIRAACGAAGLVLLTAPAVADNVRAGVVNLRTGDVRTTDVPNGLDDKAFSAKWYVIVLDGPLDPARQAALTGAGVTLAGYLPTNAFIADLSKTAPGRVKALPFVLWAGPYQAAWKIDGALANGAQGRAFVTKERQDLANNALVAADLWLFRGEPEAPVRAAIAKLAKAQVVASETIDGGVHLSIVMQGADVPKLGQLRELQFAEHAGEFTLRSNATTRWVIQSDQLNVTPFYANGITGVGQIVGVIDAGMTASHCSFYDPAHFIGPQHRKIVASEGNPPTYDPHGTHVSCTAVGDAGDNSDTRGIAYGAKMTFQYYPTNTESGVFSKFLWAHTNGARVQSNSWGDDSVTAYDGPCRAIDSFQHQYEDDLLVFAVTDLNSTVRNPENAKNSLAVSLSDNAPNEMNGCGTIGGHAPTADGRRKPEVMAPGCSIDSATGSTGCGLGIMTGTSMACPAVAGAATLVREYFTDGFFPTGQARADNAFTPSGSLIKAVLVNSAVDMTGIDGYPSDREGWGRVLISNALTFGFNPHHLILSDVRNASAQALQTGQHGDVFFYTGNCTTPLHVTLAYADAAAAAGAAFAPVNNLDLVVTSPSGQTYYGNYFVNGVSAPGGTADSINNLEQVIVASPAPGRWHVAIVGTAVNDPSGPQGYAVVITGAVDQNACGSADFNCDGDVGTDADIEAFFAALSGGFGDADFNRDGDVGTDADIESFFRVLAGQAC